MTGIGVIQLSYLVAEALANRTIKIDNAELDFSFHSVANLTNRSIHSVFTIQRSRPKERTKWSPNALKKSANQSAVYRQLR